MLFPQPMPPVPVSAEADLVIRARAGDPAAQEELAQLHRRAAFFLALQLLGNREDAMDVAQDAMLRLFTTLHRFDVRRPVRPWLNQIVRNRAIDLMRRRKVRACDSLDAVDEDGNRRYEPADVNVDLDRDVGRSQLRVKMWRTLDTLPHKQREILVLRDYQDLSYAEIAELLGIPLGTVMSRLHGARKGLRRALQEQDAEVPNEKARAGKSRPHKPKSTTTTRSRKKTSSSE